MFFNMLEGVKVRKYLILSVAVFLIFSFVGCNGVLTNNGSSSDTHITESVNYESQEVSVESEIKEVSSQQESEQEVAEFDITLSFAGDVMLANFKNEKISGGFNEYAEREKPSYFFEKVSSVFKKDDFTVVNLENVFTDNDLEEVEKDHDPAYWFRSKTSNTKILTAGGIEGVSLANNHTGDYGNKGYSDTINAVKKAGIEYGTFGKTMYYEKNGFKIAVICCGLWGASNTSAIISQIRAEEKKTDYQIIYFHGGKERIYEPEEWKVKACRSLIDNGAELVIGNHPHVLQPREIYKDKEIVYSLGNFCFGGNRKPLNRTIIYQMKLTVENETLILRDSASKIIPCYVYTGNLNNYQPAIVEKGEVKQKILDFMDGKIDSPD